LKYQDINENRKDAHADKNTVLLLLIGILFDFLNIKGVKI